MSRRRTENTGTWSLEKAEFKAWFRAASGSILFCKGIGEKQNPKSSSTPLHFIAREGLNEIWAQLLDAEQGSDAMTLLSLRDSCQRTVLHDACMGRNSPIAQQILQLNPGSIYDVDVDGATPLHLAANAGSLETIDVLLSANADLLCLDRCENTPFHRANIAAQKPASEILLREMFEVVDHPTELCTRRDKDFMGYTLLHQAAALGFEDEVGWLLDVGGADPYSLAYINTIPLHLAAAHGHVGVIQTFLKHLEVAKVQPDRLGSLPLHDAAKFGKAEACKLLVSAKPSDTIVRDLFNFTPLHWAVAGGHLEVVKMLLPLTEIALPSEVNVPRPVELAVLGNHLDVVKYLCKNLYQICEYETLSVTSLHIYTEDEFFDFVCIEGFDTAIHRDMLGVLCRIFGDFQATKGKLRAAQAWYDLRYVLIDGHQYNDGFATAFCDGCYQFFGWTEPRYRCLCGRYMCLTWPTSYGQCIRCYERFIHSSDSSPHNLFIRIPSVTPLPQLQEQLAKLRDALGSND